MIAVSGLVKRYGDMIAVNGISFNVREEETFVLLGTSGCGKTTTLKTLNRLIAPTSGAVSINGEDIAGLDAETLRRGIGYVLQHNSLFPHYTVAENIAVVPTLLRWDKKKIHSRTRELIIRLRLPDRLLGAYPHELSGGQQQRVNIARALAADPPVLLMDEPFGALDTVTRAGIVNEFAGLEELKRKTIVMVTHDVDEAFRLGDSICLMNEGRIEQQGAPKELLFHPANDFVREFFASSFSRLAMAAIRVRDIWADLEASANADAALNADATLWMVMEHMIQRKSDSPVPVVDGHGTIKQINREQLFAAITNR